MSAYDGLAVCYDRLMDFDYSALCDRYEGLFSKFCRNDAGTVLDLGCGTGKVCAELAKRGHRVIGIDCSEQMLTQAAVNIKSSKRVSLILGDIKNLDPSLKADCAVCSLDVINHFSKTQYIVEAFKSVKNALNDGGIFVFDVHGKEKFFSVLGNNCFTYDYDDMFCCWDCRLCGDRIDHTLNIFVSDGESYERYTDDFSEYYRSRRVLERAAQQAGLYILDVDGAEDDRLFFTLGKNKQ